MCFFIDINECLSIPCDKNAHCINNNGSYSCSCKAGFKGNGKVCVGMYALTCLLLSLNLKILEYFTLHLLTFVFPCNLSKYIMMISVKSVTC